MPFAVPTLRSDRRMNDAPRQSAHHAAPQMGETRRPDHSGILRRGLRRHWHGGGRLDRPATTNLDVRQNQLPREALRPGAAAAPDRITARPRRSRGSQTQGFLNGAYAAVCFRCTAARSRPGRATVTNQMQRKLLSRRCVKDTELAVPPCKEVGLLLGCPVAGEKAWGRCRAGRPRIAFAKKRV